MAASVRNCVGVDIGSHSIRAAYMEMGKAGPRVIALLEETIKVDAGLTEGQRQQQLAKQLGEMLKAGNVRTKNAVFCVPGQSVFVRRIKLPKTDPEKMGRLVRFAAREQIPFPLDKTIMEYQVFEEEESTEADVLLVAVKRDFILNFMKLVRRTGLRPIGISVSSLALYNFHEVNDSPTPLVEGEKVKKPAPEKKKKGKKGEPEPEPEPEEVEPIEAVGFEEIKAFVNLGAALMDLAIPKPGAERMIGFTRSVPLAGNEMDRAIRDKLGLDSLDEARKIKETETAVLSADFETAGDAEEVNVEASEAVTLVADRLISELRRSLDFFISQPDGVSVDRLVLSGGLAKLKYLGSYIEEKMGLPVEQAAPHHEQLRVPDTLAANFSPFAVATGLAIQGLGLAQNKIDFLPEDMKNVRGLREHRAELVALVIMVIAMIAMSFNVGSDSVAAYKRDAQSYEDVYNKYRALNDNIRQAQTRNATVAGAYDKIAKTLTWRTYWFAFLDGIHEKRPPDVLIDEIVLRVDGIATIKGKAPSQDALNRFVDGLKQLDGTGPLQPKIAEAKIMDLTPITGDPTYQLSFRLELKTFVRGARERAIGEAPAPTPTATPAPVSVGR